jgi:hypothetical protein
MGDGSTDRNGAELPVVFVEIIDRSCCLPAQTVIHSVAVMATQYGI